MNTLVIISAPSGAGKTTLCQRLLRDFRGRLVLSVSSTTRAPRGSERNGTEYFFLTPEVFKKGIESGDFSEWALVHGNYYGTARKTVDEAFRKKLSVLLDIDVQGAASLRKAYPERNFSVFIAPPSMEALERRLRARGTDSEDSIRRRIENAREEMTRQNEFDLVVVNDEIERAYAELKSAVERVLGDA